MKLILGHEQRLKEEWEDAQRSSDDIDPQDDPDQLALAQRHVRDAYRRWYEVSNQAQEMAERLRRSALENPAISDWDKAHQTLLHELREQFSGGPHYDLLCERVAGLHVRLKRMEASGRDVSPSEHAQINAQLLGYINQLQKYTEAMKSESISKEAQGVAEEILSLVEKHCAVTYPELWLTIMRDVRSALESAAA